LRVVAERAPTLPSLPPNQVEFVPWSPNDDADRVAAFDIGIMPLGTDDWSRGKCGMKMLQYMACGLPVVATWLPLTEMVAGLGRIGRLVSDKHGWIEALDALIEDRESAEAIGAEARRVAMEHFDVGKLAGVLAGHLRDVAIR
jgi:glycosyltransferase involved in cell wall biosynthesis